MIYAWEGITPVVDADSCVAPGARPPVLSRRCGWALGGADTQQAHPRRTTARRAGGTGARRRGLPARGAQGGATFICHGRCRTTLLCCMAV